MKKLLLLAIPLSMMIAFGACKKEKTEPGTDDTTGGSGASNGLVVEQVNNSLITKATATWCGPCGAWGWTLYNDIITSNKTSAKFISLYASTSSSWDNNLFYTADAAVLAQAFGIKGYPTMSTNGVNTMEYSSSGGIYTAQSKTNTDNAASAHKSATVVANSNHNLTIDGSTAKVKVTTKFFEAGSGDYYIAAYLTEDKAKNRQASQTGVVEHHHVFRASFATAWGTKISNTGANGTENFDFEVAIDNSWVKANLEVVTVIYKKNGAKYEFVNAY